jgi:hypothetical protein
LKGKRNEVKNEEYAKFDSAWAWRVGIDSGSVVNRERLIPTAAFRLLVKAIKNKVNTMLKAHTMILAMFPSEPSCPTLGIPQEMLMPTGADVALAELPVKADGELCNNCRRACQYMDD